MEYFSYPFRQHFRNTAVNRIIFAKSFLPQCFHQLNNPTARHLDSKTDIAAAWHEYQSLPNNEWRKDFFCPENGGFVATHKYKKKDDLRRPGVYAEVKACYDLAKMGKHVFRLPENIPDLIDSITIAGIPYRNLLKFKPLESVPRGYPDVFFDGQTWDFKASISKNEDTLRQLIKDGRKADNVIFISAENKHNNLLSIHSAIGREYGRRLKNGTWRELPNVYYISTNHLNAVWEK